MEEKEYESKEETNMKQYELEEGIFSYIEENGKVRLTSYQGNQAQVVIPRQIEEHPVTEIGKKTFLGRKELKKNNSTKISSEDRRLGICQLQPIGRNSPGK